MTLQISKDLDISILPFRLFKHSRFTLEDGLEIMKKILKLYLSMPLILMQLLKLAKGLSALKKFQNQFKRSLQTQQDLPQAVYLQWLLSLEVLLHKKLSKLQVNIPLSLSFSTLISSFAYQESKLTDQFMAQDMTTRLESSETSFRRN